ncbi:membrane protein [Sediminivirga luteola]|uniref:Membrane protein n=1 Tax=Sediminivirga luteola TaxID=1774748 RepID=A0A8J2TYG3_9MICO|nr:membrane protein [Sediminivirga luteola]
MTSSAGSSRPAGAATRPLLPLAAVLTTVLMWASAFVVIRWAAPDISPGPLALLRLLAGSVTLTVLVLLVRRGRPRLPRGKALVLTGVFGVAWFAIYTVAFNWAGHYLDAGTIAMIVNLSPLLTALGAVLFFKEAFSRRLFLGMGISLAGIALIAVAGSTGRLALTGILIALAAAFLYTTGMLVQKVVLRTVDPLTATWLGCLAGTLALLPFAAQTAAEWEGVSAGTLLAAVYMGVGPTALAFWCWGYAMNHFSTGRVASSTLAVPAVVILLSAATLGEIPPPMAILGGGVCLAGVAVSQWRRSRPRRSHLPA